MLFYLSGDAMDNFKVIYKILKALERAMDYEEFDKESISAERLEISKPRWTQLIIMMYTEGLISGVKVTTDGLSSAHVVMIRPQITLKGLTYLSENSLMKTISNTIKGVVEIGSNLI